jgi:hypothetical protein
MAYSPGIVPQGIQQILSEYLAREFRRIANDLGSGSNETVRFITTSERPQADDELVLANASSATISVSLPAIALGRRLTFKKIDGTAHTVILDAEGTETIDGADTQTLSVQYQFITIVGGISDWHIIGQ